MKYDLLFISPHLDDVIYSCSQHIRNKIKTNKILVVTIFTHYPKNNSSNPFINGECRIKEDQEILRTLGVDYMHLHYSELMIRNELSNYNLCRQIVEPLKTLLNINNDNNLIDDINYDIQKIINDYKIKETYYPSAIGFHPDHILVYRSCYNLKNTKLFCYEDFPYSFNWIYKQIRLPFLKPKNILKVKINIKEKIKDIKAYKSQYNIIFMNKDLPNILKNSYEVYYY